jgi:anti-sigma factor RsiW
MTCRELVELITEYLEGALPQEDQRRFEAHLAGCPWCTAYVEQMRATVRLSGRLSEEDVPAPVRDSLLAAFRNWRAGRAPGGV